MKNHLLSALIAFTVITANAQQINSQNPLAPLPFHQVLMQTRGNVQADGNSRAIIHKQIGFRGDVWNNLGTGWVGSDSASFIYNSNAQPILDKHHYFALAMWNNSVRNSTAYNVNGTAASYLTVAWVTQLASFRNQSQYTYTYDGNNNQTEELGQNWDTTGAAWVNSVKHTWAYTAGYVTEYTAQVWNTGSWENESHTLYTRDANGNMLTSIYQDWNSGASAWVNKEQNIYTYDAGNRVTAHIQQNWNGGTSNWENYLSYTYTYDANGNQINDALSTWNNSGSTWDNTYQSAYTYDSTNHQLTFMRQQWLNSAWVNSSSEVQAYDANGDKTAYEMFGWNADSSNWVPQTRYTYLCDNNHNRIYELKETYNGTNHTYKNFSRHYYYYQPFNVTGIAAEENALNAAIFPNPASHIHLQFALLQSAPLTLNVYDASGRLLLSQNQTGATGTNSLNIDAATLAPGNYFVQLQNQSTQQTSVLKFAKQ